MPMVSCSPRAAASAAARVAAASAPPPSTIAWYAPTAGPSASTIVLSPSFAAPSCRMPSSAACNAAPSWTALTSASSPRTFAACRNPVPYRGPDAPPVLLISARPTVVSTAAGVDGSVSSSIASAAWKPRRRLMPWSASPMAASRWVRWSALSTTSWVASAIQARKALTSIGIPLPSFRLWSAAPAQCRGLDGGVPEFGQLGGELADGDRAAGHLQAGDVVADQAARDGNAVALQPLRDGREDDVQLDEWGATESVDHHQRLAGQRHVGVDGLQRNPGDLPGRDELASGTARFAVDAHTELDLVLAQLEAGLAGRRDGARGQRHAERAGPVVDLPGQSGGGGQVRVPFGRRADDLLDKDRGPGTPPARRPGAVLHRHVVVDHDGLDLYSLVARELGGHLEVQHVAGVVLHDVQHAGSGVDGLGGGQDLVRYR